MDTDSSMQVIVLAALIFLSAIFSSAETAFLSTNKIRMRNLQEDGEKKADLVLTMLENQSKLISTLLVGNNIVNIGSSALATKMATAAFGDVGVGIATGVMTFLVLVFGEVVHKNVACGPCGNMGNVYCTIYSSAELRADAGGVPTDKTV